MSEPCTAEVLAQQPTKVLVGGKAFAWTPQNGLDSCAVLEIQHYIRREANKFRSTAAVQGIGIEDLVQECLAAGIMAARRYDPTLGASYLTFAAFWIRQTLLRALRENHVKIGERTRNALRTQNALPQVFSLDIQIVEGGATRAELLASDDDGPHAEAELTAEALGLHQAMAQLKPRDREVLTLRYGLGCEIQSQPQIAARWGISRQRVSAIEYMALIRLRRIIEKPSKTANPGKPKRRRS